MEISQLKKGLHTTVYSSLFVQFITGIFDIYAYFLPASGELLIIKKMLELEIFVQIIEGSFYVWLASVSSHIRNITPNRYYDWIITTPTMLFTFCLYLDFLGERTKSEREQLLPTTVSDTRSENTAHPSRTPELGTSIGVRGLSGDSPKKSVKNTDLLTYLTDNKNVFLPIFFLNWLMLIFGYLGEIGKMDNRIAVGCGFLPFITFFAIIYNKFAKYSSFGGKILFWWFFAIWALYGIAALASYYWKNICYNILDLFSKNFFGFILAYTLYHHAI